MNLLHVLSPLTLSLSVPYDPFLKMGPSQCLARLRHTQLWGLFFNSGQSRALGMHLYVKTFRIMVKIKPRHHFKAFDSINHFFRFLGKKWPFLPFLPILMGMHNDARYGK